MVQNKDKVNAGARKCHLVCIFFGFCKMHVTSPVILQNLWQILKIKDDPKKSWRQHILCHWVHFKVTGPLKEALLGSSKTHVFPTFENNYFYSPSTEAIPHFYCASIRHVFNLPY